MAGIAPVVTWPDGTADLNLHTLVELTAIPVVVEIGGTRFRLTGWDATYEVFTAIEEPKEELDVSAYGRR